MLDAEVKISRPGTKEEISRILIKEQSTGATLADQNSSCRVSMASYKVVSSVGECGGAPPAPPHSRATVSALLLVLPVP